MSIKASEQAYKLIRDEEGFVPTSRDDGAGNNSIGYGDFDGNQSGTITIEEAERRLKKRVGVAEQELGRLITRPDLTQSQMDMLIDVHYNRGLGNMKGLIDLVNSRQDKLVKSKLDEYVFSNGKKIDALVRRNEKRASMWDSVAPQDMGDILNNVLGRVDSVANENDPLVSALGAVDSDSEMAQQIDPERRRNGLSLAAELANSEAALKNTEARRLSSKLGIPLQEAKDRLAFKDMNTILTEQGHDIIAENFPAVAQMVDRDPDNYVMLRETGPYMQKVELAARNTRRDERSDWTKSLDQNRVMLKESLTYLGMSTGQVSLEEGKKLLLEVDQERQGNSLSSKSSRTVNEVMESNDSSFLDKLKVMLAHPEAAAQIMAQSQGSTVAIMGSSIAAGAAGTAAGGPAVGAGSAAMSAYMVSHLLSFSEHMTKQLNEFRDPITGEINIDLAYSDPARVRKWQKEADIYGLTMGAGDALFSLLGGALGKGVSKHVFNGKGAMSKVAKKTAEVAAEGAGKMLEEGGSQLLASTAVDVHRGDGLKNLKENYKDAENEALLSTGPAIGMTALRHGAAKTVDLLTKANKANEDLVTVSGLRKEVQSNEAVKKNPEQVKELLQASLTPPPIPEDENAPVIDEPEKLVDSEIRNMDREAVLDTTAITPRELEAHYGSREKAIEALQFFGPEVVQAYSRARESDSSVFIPTADWVMFTEENPEIDAIARFNGNDMNGLEANAVIEKVEANPLTLFENGPRLYEEGPKGWDNIEGDPEGAKTKSSIEIIEADPNDPNNLKMRPVELYSRFRDDSEKAVHSSILNRLKKTAPETDIKALEVFTELQYRHMQNRAEMLGVHVQDIAKKLKIGKQKGELSSINRGAFRASGQLSDPYTVAFKPNADIKTVIHEFGHSWLHELAMDYFVIAGINPETMTLAQKEYKIAMDSMAEFAGLQNIGELLNADPVQQEIIHERFARTVESYFLEGNLENNNMRVLMETFRKWVVMVADRIKSILNIAQYPPLKMTPKVERMMEAILGASTYVENEVVPMLPEPLLDPKALGEKGPKYIESILLARSEAVARAYSKSFNRGLKDREALIDKELDKIYLEATKEVDSRRAMLMLSGFQDAYAEHKNDAEGDIPDPRLSFESVMKVLCNNDLATANTLKETVPRVIIAGKKKGGLNVETFMLINGIDSTDELMSMLLETAQREELIEERANQLIKEKFPVLKSDDEIHELAVASVQGRGRERVMMDEIGILMEKYPADYKTLVSKLINPPAYIGKPVREAFKASGTKIIAEANAFKFAAKNFLLDAGRHGREAARFYRKNNIVEALDAKMKEALHFFAYKEAIKAQKLVAETTLRIKQFEKYARSKDLARKYDADVMAFGKQLIQLAGHGRPLPYLSRDGFSAMSGLSESHIDTVNKAIDRYQRAANGRFGKNISVGGYAEFGLLMKTIMFNARKAKEVEIKDRKEQIDEVGDSIVADIGEGNTVSMEGETWVSSLRASTVNVRTLFESLYGSPEAFAASGLGQIYHAVTNAEAKRSLELQKYRDRIAKAVRAAAGDSGIVAPLVNRLPIPVSWKLEDKAAKPIIGQLGMDFKTKKRRDFTFKNKGELHMANLLMGSESGAKKFLLGHNLTVFNEETQKIEPDYEGWNLFVERMISDGTLTEKDFKMYEEVWKSFEEIHPLVKEAMRRSDGFNMGYIQGQQVKNSLGTFAGGYVPVSPIRDMMNPGMVSSLLEVDSMGYRIDSLYPNMNTGMTNERTESYSELNLDMGRLNTYLSAALNIAHLRNPLLDFGKVIETPQVRAAIEARRPGAIGDAKSGVIVRWFNSVKAQEYTEFSNDAHQKIARYIRLNVNMAMYLGAWTSIVKQYFGLLPAAARVGGANLVAANLRTGFGALKSSRKFMTEKSVVMASRMSDSQEMMVRSWDELNTNFDWISWTNDKAKQFQWFFIQMTQNMVDTSTWHAGYQRASKLGMSEAAAINFADDAVKATQSSPDVSNMSNTQRGKDADKLIMMVTSVPIAMNNLLQAEVMRDQKAVNKAKAIVVLGLLAFVAPAMLDGLFSELTDEDDLDEDDEEAMNKAMGLIALRTVTGSFDSLVPIPYVRMATSAIQFGTGSVSPGLAKPASAIAKTVKGVQNLSKGVDLSAKETSAMLDTLTILTGLPASIIGKGFLYEHQFLIDETEREDRSFDRRDQLAASRD